MSKRRPIEYVVNENGCHICTSHAKDTSGYPSMSYRDKKTRIHRYIYEQHYGSIPKGMVIRHKCDDRACINPLHLEIGTQNDNIQDMVKRGRIASKVGEKNPRAKLTEMDVKIIRRNKLSSYKLCKLYGVSPSTIRQIRQYRRWSHVA